MTLTICCLCSCGALFVKILNDLTRCNEKRVTTNTMTGTVPGCQSLAGDLHKSSLAKARTELRFLDLSSTPQRQESLQHNHLDSPGFPLHVLVIVVKSAVY